MNNKELEGQLLDYLKWVVESRSTPTGYEFRCIEDIVLTHGDFFNPSTLPPKFNNMPKKYCFNNAYELMIKNKGLTYCEGYAIRKAGYPPLIHAWCADEFRNVIDVTWDYDKDGMAYFGIPFNGEFVIKMFKKGKGSLLDDPGQRFPLMKEFKEEYKRLF